MVVNIHIGIVKVNFVFQAGDGIRDPLVTGVQTCALPISALLDGLVAQALEKEAAFGRPESRTRRSEIRAALRRSRELRALLYRLWPVLTPTEFLGDLLSSRVLVRAAAKGVLLEEEGALLHRDGDETGEWSAADVPLLDEAAELLGEPRASGGKRRRGAGHSEETGRDRTLAEAASADRTWTYGHVIVDEAQ